MVLSEKEQEVLSRCFLFHGLEEVQRQKLMEQGEKKQFSSGSIIYSPRHFRQAIGVILWGKVQVHSPGGVLLNTLHPGNCFGVAALFHPAQRYVSTVTAQEESGILFYSGTTLEQMFICSPLIARNYISFLSQRIQFLNEKIGSFTAPTAQARLALWLLAHSPQPQVESYTQLSRELNLGRASLYRALEALEEEGIIRRQGNCIHLLSPEELETLAHANGPPTPYHKKEFIP